MACARCGDPCLCTSVGDSAFVRLSVSDQIPSTRESKIGFIAASTPRHSQSSVGLAEPAYQPPPSPPPSIYDRMAAKAAEARKLPVERDAEDNLIEFPKPSAPQNLFAEELAESLTTPRILDVPDEMHETEESEASV